MRTTLIACTVVLTLGIAWILHEPTVVPTPEPTVSPLTISATPAEQQGQAFLLPAAQPIQTPTPDTEVREPALDANAALVYHIETDRVLFSKNEAIRAPIASLTKILTALTVHDVLDAEELVIVGSASVRVDGMKQTLSAQERIRVRDLLTLMLVESSNDAAYALAAHASATSGIDLVGAMNERAHSIGMPDSSFTDPAGLDDNAFSTPRDLIKLVRVAQREPILWESMRSPVASVSSDDGQFLHVAENTNQLLGQIPGIMWGKTGYTDGALGCMILVVEIPGGNGTLVSIVLGSRSRFTDTKSLVEWALSAWDWD